MPARIFTKADIINLALMKCGQTPNYPLGVRESLKSSIELIYENVIDDTFSLHDWTWAKQKTRLNLIKDHRADGLVSYDYRYVFRLTDNVSGAFDKFLKSSERIDDPVREFEIVGTELHINCHPVWVVLNASVDPTLWERGFRNAFIVALASELAVPLKQDIDLRDSLEAKAFGTSSQGRTGGLFGRVIARDITNRARNLGNQPDPLTNAHRSSGTTIRRGNLW